jgi:quercetin dioxygenase-like cupin family protein
MMNSFLRIGSLMLPLGAASAAATVQNPPAISRGFTEQVIREVDLGPEIDGMAGRTLRMRLITMAPGAASPLHNHVGRPGTVYVLSGRIIDHRDGRATAYGPGPGWPEDHATTHWIENREAVPAVEISVDILNRG